MRDEDRTREELIAELHDLRQRVDALEQGSEPLTRAVLSKFLHDIRNLIAVVTLNADLLNFALARDVSREQWEQMVEELTRSTQTLKQFMTAYESHSQRTELIQAVRSQQQEEQARHDKSDPRDRLE